MRISTIDKVIHCNTHARKMMLLLAMGALSTVPSQAQSLSQGLSAFSFATDGVLSYVDSVRSMCYVLAGCMSIVGACGVYWQMISEAGNIKKPIVSSVAACIMFISLGTALPSFFGIGGGSGSSGNGGSGTTGYLDNNGKFKYDDWYADRGPLSGWEIMYQEECIAPAYRNNIWE